MTNLLVRLFVKDREQVEDPKVRAAYGTMAGAVGICCNLVLFLAKLIIGTLSGSVSITADAVNNLSDASSSIMTLIGFRLAQKPEDAEHPYGHARMEYLTGLGVAALILLIGVQLAKSSFAKILRPSPVEFSGALVVVLALSIAVKLWMALFNRTLGKRINSTSLMATAADSRNDVISTGAVLAAAIVAQVTGLFLDGYIGFLVALFILYSAVGIAKETISPLLGAPADEELVHRIRHTVAHYDPRILGVHDLMVHDYGPGQTFASIHVEVDRREDVVAVHEMIDEIERVFLEEQRIHLTIHYDPIVTDDMEVSRMRERVHQQLAVIDPRLNFHDFRMVVGPEHTNLIFDVVLPYDLMDQTAQITQQLEESLQEPDRKYHLVLTFDAEGFNH
jgi:cation diffusion facilitator family transporter